MVSILLLYFNFPPLRSTIQWSPFSFFIYTFPPWFPPYNGLHSTSLFKLPPPCVPPNNGLHSTSLLKLPPPAFHHTVLYILLLYLNFPPLRSTITWSPFHVFIQTSAPCVPPYHGLHSTSLFKLPPPAFHHTMVSIPFLYLNFPPPCVPPYNGLHSTSLFKLPPPAFHHTMVSILLLYLNFPPLRSTIQWSPFHFFI